jgi:hypothetical protein
VLVRLICLILPITVVVVAQERVMVKDKRLDAGTPFISELLKGLTEAIRNTSAQFTIPVAMPATTFEMEIKTALEISIPIKK